MYFVYSLINKNGNVEYVGNSNNPKRRYIEHMNKKVSPVYNRRDLSLRIEKNFNEKIEARDYEIELQKFYGLIDEDIKRSYKKLDELNPNCKYTNKTIKNINDLIDKGYRNIEIENILGISNKYISLIRNKKRRTKNN